MEIYKFSEIANFWTFQPCFDKCLGTITVSPMKSLQDGDFGKPLTSNGLNSIMLSLLHCMNTL